MNLRLNGKNGGLSPWLWIGMAAGAAGGVALARRWWRTQRVDLRGEVVLITGGSRGLGLLLAREFAREGCRIVLSARDRGELDRAVMELEQCGAEVFAVTGDVTQPAEVDEIVRQARARFGSIDILVNNAGIIQVGPLDATTVADFERGMAVNFWGPLHATLAALPEMRARGKGRIVNIASLGGKVAIPHLLPYNCAKFALVGLSEGLRAELAKEGVHVTTVIPGLMRTGSHTAAEFKGDPEHEYAWFSLAAQSALTSMDAARAARRIVAATKRGDAEVVLGWQAKMIHLIKDLFPSVIMSGLGVVNRLLPVTQPGNDGRAIPGGELEARGRAH